MSRGPLPIRTSARLDGLRAVFSSRFVTALAVLFLLPAAPAVGAWEPPDDSWERLDADLIRFHHLEGEAGLVLLGPDALQGLKTSRGGLHDAALAQVRRRVPAGFAPGRAPGYLDGGVAALLVLPSLLILVTPERRGLD